MKTLALAVVLAGLSMAGQATARDRYTTGGLEIPSEGLMQEVQYRRGGPRCFTQVRRVRFVDRFGRQRVRVVERRVCR